MTNYIKLTCTQFSPQPKPIKAEKKKPAPIKKLSAKREKENKEYLTLNKVYLENNPWCKVKGCKNASTSVHHKKGRIGKLLCDIRFWLATCMGCHSEIEKRPQWAYENGYSLLRNAK